MFCYNTSITKHCYIVKRIRKFFEGRGGAAPFPGSFRSAMRSPGMLRSGGKARFSLKAAK